MLLYVFLQGIRRYLRESVRLFRVSVYLICAFTLLSFCAARSLHAQLREGARLLGRQLADLPELTGGAEVIRLNGARLHYARTTLAAPISALLDRFEKHCNDHMGPLGEVLQELEQQNPGLKNRIPKSHRNFVLRQDGEREGVLICLTDDRRTGLGWLQGALQRFAKSSDLSEFGHFRYAFLSRTDSGNTLAVTMWTDGELKLGEMFPSMGDAAGSDSPVVPRPPASKRTLSAAREGSSFGLRLYETSQSAETVQRFYDEWMKQRGWLRGAEKKAHGATAYFRQDGYQTFVTLSEADGETFVSLLEAGRPGGESLATARVRAVRD